MGTCSVKRGVENVRGHCSPEPSLFNSRHVQTFQWWSNRWGAMDGQAKVIYQSKDGRTSKAFEALDWLAQLVTHFPNKGEQMKRY